MTAGMFGSSLSDTSGVVSAFGSNGFWDGFGISFSSSPMSAELLVLFLNGEEEEDDEPGRDTRSLGSSGSL